jgi:hypothetical protein
MSHPLLIAPIYIHGYIATSSQFFHSHRDLSDKNCLILASILLSISALESMFSRVESESLQIAVPIEEHRFWSILDFSDSGAIFGKNQPQTCLQSRSRFRPESVSAHSFDFPIDSPIQIRRGIHER